MGFNSGFKGLKAEDSVCTKDGRINRGLEKTPQ